MQDEKKLLLAIKKQFGWPVNLRRYGFSDRKEYWDGNSTVSELSPELQQKVRYSKNKIQLAKRLLARLLWIPWIQGIFITGSVASYNARATDDIDVWLLVDERRIWLTRALDFLLYVFTGNRRLSVDGVEDTRVNNKLCFNLYTTPSGSVFEEHSASYAMQFVDTLPILLKHPNRYSALVTENEWVKEYFPTWYAKHAKSKEIQKSKTRRVYDPLLDVFEYVAGVLMLMKSTKRIELRPKKIFIPRFTTWGTKRILYVDDNEITS